MFPFAFRSAARLLVLFTLMVALCIAVPVMAQNGDPEVSPAPTEVLVVPVEALEDTGSIVVTVGSLITALVAAFVGGAGVVGIIGIAQVIVSKIRNDKAFATAIERLWMSTPYDFRTSGRNVITGAKEVFDLLEDLTDGVEGTGPAGAQAANSGLPPVRQKPAATPPHDSRIPL